MFRWPMYLFALSFLVSLTSTAGVFYPGAGLVAQTPTQFCWWGDSEATRELRGKIEAHVLENLKRAGVHLLREGWASCERLPKKSAWGAIGVVIYDDPFWADPKNQVILKKNYLEFDDTESRELRGHPRGMGEAVSYMKTPLDFILTSRFQSVTPELSSLAKSLSEKGRENLILSIALHEVLHIFGLAHEHIHPNSTCRIEDEPPLASHDLKEVEVTPYDQDSVMDYCMTKERYDYEKGPLGLSEGDMATLRRAYP